MNHFKNFSLPLIFSRSAVVLSAIALCLLATENCAAQGQFSQNFQPPVTENGFPVHTDFDPQVRTADLIVQNQLAQGVQQAIHDDSPAAVIGSSTDMIASLTSSVKDQWQQGNWNQGVGSYFKNIDIGRMLGSLAIVLGGYFALVWISRQLGGRSGQVPNDVLEVLGQVPFGPKKHLQIVRLGSKLLLLINGPEGTHPIGEITDPNEVEYLASLCTGKKNTHGAKAFSIAKAAVSNQSSPTVNISSNPVPQPSVGSVPQTPVANNPNHLAAILQSLNGQSGSGAVFEA